MLKKIVTILSAGLFISFAFPDDPVLDPIGNIEFDEDLSITIDLTATDIDGDPLVFLCVPSDNINCSIEDNGVNGEAQITFSSVTQDWTGTEELTVIVIDGNDGTDAEDIDVTVNPANDPPTSEDVLSTTPEETPINIELDATDIDTNDLLLQYSVVADPSFGTAVNNNNGFILYTPLAPISESSLASSVLLRQKNSGAQSANFSSSFVV